MQIGRVAGATRTIGKSQGYMGLPIRDERIEFHGFISDVRPYYAAANVVIVPTRVSAGTNLKVIEAMACERAIVSTTSR